MKEANRVVAVRLDDQTLKNIEYFAENAGLVHDTGDLNISAAIRMLISLGLKEPIPIIEHNLWQSARGAAMHELVEKLYSVIKEYRDKV